MTKYFRNLRQDLAIVRAGLAFILVAAGIASLGFRAWAQCVVPSTTLSLWHPLDEPEGGVVGGQTSISTSGVTFVPGRVGSAMELGVAGSGLLVTLPEGGVNLGSFTVEGWVRRRTLGVATTDGEGGVILGGGPSGLVFAMLSTGRLTLSSGGVSRVDSEASIQDLNWHHVAVTRSGSLVRFYVDGVDGGVADYGAVFSPSPVYGIGKFGAQVLGLTGTFLGALDEVSLYRSPLSADEIRAIHAAGEFGKCGQGFALRDVYVPPTISRDSEFVVECLAVPRGLNDVPDAELSLSLAGGLTVIRGTTSVGTVSLETNVATVRVPVLPARSGARIRFTVKSAGPTVGTVIIRSKDSVVSRAVSIVPSCTDASGVAGYWPLDGSGIDLIGGASGVLRGGARWVDGRNGVGRALEVGGNSDALVVGSPTSLGLDVFSIEMWLRRGSITQTTVNGVAAVLAAGTDGSYCIGLSPTGELLFSQVGIVLATIPTAIRDLAWHHLSMVREDGAMAFYLDGTLAGRVPFAGRFGATTAFAIGSLPVPSFGVSYGFVGTIDDLTIWNRRLSPAEIQGRAAGVASSFCALAAEFQTTLVSSVVLPLSTNRVAWKLRNTGASVMEGVIITNEWPAFVGVTDVESSKGFVTVAEGGLRIALDRLIPGDAVEFSLGVFPKGSGVASLTSKAFSNQSLFVEVASSETLLDVGVTCAQPISGLQALYRGDGDLKDATGRYPAVPENTVGFTGGRVRGGFDFKGTGGVAVPDSAWLNRQDFTVDAWVYPTAYNGREDIIVNREANASSLQTIQFELGIRGPQDPVGTIPVGNLAVFVSGLNGMPNNHNGWTDAGAAVPLNRWSHVAMAVEPGRVRVFLNGVKVSEFVGLTGTMPSMDAPFRIGARSQTFPGWEADRFDGRIDEVGVYTRALLNDEVLSLFLAGAAGRCDADLRISWEGLPAKLAVGDSFLAKLRLENVGNQPLANVRLTNTVPAGWSVTGLTTTVGTVTWNAGTISGQFGVVAPGQRVSVDIVVQADVAQEGILLARGYADSGELNRTDNEASVTVSAVPVTLTVVDVERAEGGAADRVVLSVPVRLSVPVSRTVSVDYVLGPPRPGSGRALATAGVDFEVASGRLVFAPGEIEKLVPVVLLGDPFYEPDEAFGLVLSNPVGATVEGLLPVLTILNDDSVPQISIGDARMDEGDSGTQDLIFPVTMVGLAGVDLEIIWATTTNETARMPFDYTVGAGAVVIRAGTTAADIRIPVVGDSVEEPNEYLTVSLSAGPALAGLVNFGKSSAVGTIRNDDRSAGVVRGFEWVTPPSAVAGEPFPAQLRAVDGRGGVVSNFNGVVALAGFPSDRVAGNTMPSQLLISEVDTRTTDAVEFQNVTAGNLDVSGWRVSFYDYTRWPLPRATFVLPVGTVVASGAVFRIQEGGLLPSALPRFSLGQSLEWGVDRPESVLTTRPVAVLLQDSTGVLRDLFAASGADLGQIDIPLTVNPEQWPGFPMGGVNGLTPSTHTYQRVGWWGVRGVEAWERAVTTLAGQNNRMRVPFVDGRLLAVSPPVLATFADGAWVGTLTMNPPVGRHRLLADDGSGRVGVSEAISFLAPSDLRIVTFQAANPYVIRDNDLSVRLVVSNAAPREATGVVVEIPVEGDLGLNSQSFTVLRSSQGTASLLPAITPSRPRPIIQAVVGTLAAGGVVTVEFTARPNPSSGPLPITLVAEARRTGGVGGAGIVWAELPLEVVDGVGRGRLERLAWWRAELNELDTMGRYDGLSSGVSYGVRLDQRVWAFNGQQSVVVPAGVDYRMEPTAGLALSAWLRSRPGGRDRQVVFEIPGGTNGATLSFVLRDGRPSFEWNGQWLGTDVGFPELRDGEWHYVTWNILPSQSIAGVRVDRSFAYLTTGLSMADALRVGGGAFSIGQGASGEGFDGEMDELVLYRMAQSSGEQHLLDYAAGALGQSLSDLRAALTRIGVSPPPITVGRPYTLTLAVTNHGPLAIPNLNLRWQNHTSAVVSEVRSGGLLVPSTKTNNVDRADLGSFSAGQGTLVTITFQVNRDIIQLSSQLTLSAGLRDRVATVPFTTSVLPDPDGDGLPSSWELANGLNPADPADAFLDRDGDGFGALAEYDAGTDAASALSFPTTTWRVSDGGILILAVSTTADRNYRLERTGTLRGPAGWDVLESRPGTGGVLEFFLQLPGDSDQSYFRIKPIPLW